MGNDVRTLTDTEKTEMAFEDGIAASRRSRSNALLADDDHLAYFIADGVLAKLEVSGRTVAARMILQAIDQYKANRGGMNDATQRA
jgi:hypothetical protein